MPTTHIVLRELIAQEVEKYDQQVKSNPHLHPANQLAAENFIEGMLYVLAKLEGREHRPGIENFRRTSRTSPKLACWEKDLVL